VDRSGQVQAPDCGAPASRHGFSGELILLSVVENPKIDFIALILS